MSGFAGVETSGLLSRAQAGDRDAAGEFYNRVYDELRQIAQRLLTREATEHTLQPTAVVNELWIKLQGTFATLPALDGRAHFRCIAARAMRQILVDYANKRNATKRGGGAAKMAIDEADKQCDPNIVEVLAVHEALEKLTLEDQRSAKCIELQYFAGCTVEETAVALQVSEETVKKDRRFANAWLKRCLS